MHVLSTVIVAAAAAAGVSALVVTNMPANMPGHSRPSVNFMEGHVSKAVDSYPAMEAREKTVSEGAGREHEIEARGETAMDESRIQDLNEHASNAVGDVYHEIEPRKGGVNPYYNNHDQYSGSNSKST
ncbi:hypothetical protein CTA2_10396 [Colletotrichum tanaceti]|uniref:Uncharacterized protein n=1 Tax=Colletotrichum tanaceti TaxID=1306861 RepID=A0A4V6DHK0_9PEZI|nr:hypothetical protein CTA2_10396 [Colletotrichum tanaceti]TKW55736.1 hypothetical protein CTA1_10640 [Colletotrichum tanaceti]